jgi:4a-hydroxytetrahydrobiopterin dehydratase
MKREMLTTEQLNAAVEQLDGWKVTDSHLTKRLEFPNFAESLAFVNAVGELAEAADHHPDITFGWGYAELKLTTHDRGGVTDVDLALARKIDGLASISRIP